MGLHNYTFINDSLSRRSGLRISWNSLKFKYQENDNPSVCIFILYQNLKVIEYYLRYGVVVFNHQTSDVFVLKRIYNRFFELIDAPYEVMVNNSKLFLKNKKSNTIIDFVSGLPVALSAKQSYKILTGFAFSISPKNWK